MNKLAIVISHPVQYYSPLFVRLAQQCNLKVFYTFGRAGYDSNYDEGFKMAIKWDIPLLKDYDYQFLQNDARRPGLNAFFGIDNPRLPDEIKKFNPDAILVFGWSYKSHLAVLRHFKGKIPVWFRGDSTLLDEQGPIKRVLRKFLLSWVYSHVDKAFYVGTANKDYFKAFGMQESQLIFTPHAIDNERFAENRKAEAKMLRAKLDIPEDYILILFAGKLEEKKDPLTLLNAFKSAAKKTVHLLFVGNGILEQQLKEESGQSTSIHFMGFQNQQQMPAIYQMCDVFCLPSKGPNETWGLAINEAMAAGKAIISADKVGGSVDLVSERNGFVFQAGNVPQLTEIIKGLDKKKLELLGEASKIKIAPWSLQNTAEAMISPKSEV